MKSLRRVPSPLTDVPEEMEELAELDEAAADALRRLFEHCDAAAAYVDDDLDVNGGAAGGPGWMTVTATPSAGSSAGVPTRRRWRRTCTSGRWPSGATTGSAAVAAWARSPSRAQRVGALGTCFACSARAKRRGGWLTGGSGSWTAHSWRVRRGGAGRRGL